MSIEPRAMSYQSSSALRLPSFAIRHLPFVILIILITYPLLISPYPTIGDGLNHFYRLAELERHILQGEFYPRWLSTLHYGFGSPLFNFYSPLSYYLALLFRPFASLADSLKLAYLTALIIATWGAYTWARDEYDSDLAALGSAAAYGMAPYIYFNIFQRGAYPETWALALAPWLLLTTRRLTRHPSRLIYLSFPLLYAALILTHTISAFIITPTVIGLLVISNWEVSHEQPAISPQQTSVIRPSSLVIFHFSLFILGITLAAFFILPIIFESQFIQLNRTTNLVDLDYQNNFLPFTTLFSFPLTFDPNRVINAMPASLSLGAVLLVIGNWLLGISRSPSAIRQPLSAIRHSSVVIFHLSFFILFIFLITPFSQPLWAITPFAQFIQFPWRLVGLASLVLAMLVGASLQQLQKSNSALALLSLVIGLFTFFLFSLSWSYHNPYDTLPVTLTSADTIQYERNYNQLGTTSNGEFLPKWVIEIPKEKVISDKCEVKSIKLNERVWQCESAQEFTFTLNQFYFPSWSATLDRQNALLTPSVPNGLSTLQVPAGQHTIRVINQNTVPQIIGTIISLLSVIILLSLVQFSYQSSATTL